MAVWEEKQREQIEKIIRYQLNKGGGAHAKELAAEMGYKNVCGVNGVVGRFAHEIADALGIARGKCSWFAAIIHYNSYVDQNANSSVWRLRRNFVLALQECGTTAHRFRD